MCSVVHRGSLSDDVVLYTVFGGRMCEVGSCDVRELREQQGLLIGRGGDSVEARRGKTGGL